MADFVKSSDGCIEAAREALRRKEWLAQWGHMRVDLADRRRSCNSEGVNCRRVGHLYDQSPH
jgi:hypothetical protein